MIERTVIINERKITIMAINEEELNKKLEMLQQVQEVEEDGSNNI